MRTLSIWRRQKPEKPITVIFQSPGGSVVPGLALWDYFQELKDEGIKLTTIARGYAASMAGILLQAGDLRIAGRESWILIHEVSAGAMGSWGELTDRMDWLERVQDRILDIFADRAKASAAEKPATKAFLKKNWKRKDWWISSDEALKLGIVDEVR
jgi:ATP-dependent protease ClpP protease subunit